MINQLNVQALIQHLYQKKYNAAAPQELIEKWGNLSQSEINENLDKLFFENWKSSAAEKDLAIANFLEVNNIATNTPAVSSGVSVIPPTPTTSITVPQTNNISQPIPPTQAPPVEQQVYYEAGPTTGQRVLKIVTWIVVLGLVALATYIGYKYYKFSNLHQLYTLTERVTLRGADGKEVGTMDLNGGNGSSSYASVTAYDEEIYNRPIDSTGKLYEHRKVLLKSDDFMKYLMDDESIIAYVNAKLVIDNEADFQLYRKLFGSLNTIDNNRLSLKQRKIIASSIKKSSALSALYLVSGCSNSTASIRRSYSSFIINEINKESKYQIIARLSNGSYYQFVGDVVSNIYDTPSQFNFEASESLDKIMRGDILFSQSGSGATKKYNVTDCFGKKLRYEANIDGSGLITSFRYVPPVILPPTPSPDSIDIPEVIQDVIEGAGDLIRDNM